ncbi:MAG: glycosyltransferase [Flavobacteriaceae bacterium]|nr:glycosyltransferase [Flavobacteriaceae bacterium]
MRETVPHIQALKSHSWELFIIPNSQEQNEWQNDKRIKIIDSGKVGPASKRDLGARKASGSILVFLDDDSYPESNILEIASKYFKDPNIIALGGPGITPITDDFWQKVSSAVFLSNFTGGSPERYLPIGKAREIDDWPSVNLMVRKDIFLSVGGFDCQYWPGEDTKLCLKLKRTGKKLVYVPEMIVWHHRRAGIAMHLRQIGAYGLHRGFFARHYPETSFRLKYFAPSIFAITVFLTMFIKWLPTETQVIFELLWVMYGIGLLIGFMQILRHEPFIISLMATVFYTPLTHFYYGIQFLRGLFKTELVSKLR